MNDHTTTDPEDLPDERVLAALRDVGPTAPEVRRAHLDAALDEYDRVVPLAPVVPLRRRSTRVLQVAAVVVLVVAGAAVVIQVGGSNRSDQASTAAESVTSDAEAGAADVSDDDGAASGATDDAGATDASSPETAPPRVEAASGTTLAIPPGELGSFDSVDALVDALHTSEAYADAARSNAEEASASICAAPADLGPGPELAGTATVAGERRLVWVLRGADGVVTRVAVVDPASCLSTG